MAGILSKKWHNKRAGWNFFPAPVVHASLFGVYQPTYKLDRLLELAEHARPAMQRHGDELAALLKGSFTLAENKDRDQSLRSIAIRDFDLPADQLTTSANSLLDPVRGCLLVDGNEGIEHARTKLRSILDYKQQVILAAYDRYSRPAANNLRGICLYSQMPNGVIGEIQVHTREYWEGMNRLRSKYETYRDFAYEYYLHYRQQQESQDQENPTPSLVKEWREADQSKYEHLRKERKQALAEIAQTTGVTSLELKDTDYRNDCSFPLRPAINSKTGLQGFLVPAYMQKEMFDNGTLNLRPAPV